MNVGNNNSSNNVANLSFRLTLRQPMDAALFTWQPVTSFVVQRCLPLLENRLLLYINRLMCSEEVFRDER